MVRLALDLQARAVGRVDETGHSLSLLGRVRGVQKQLIAGEGRSNPPLGPPGALDQFGELAWTCG
jgi:hypothetical protein